VNGFLYGFGRGFGWPLGWAAAMAILLVLLTPEGRAIVGIVIVAIGVWIWAAVREDEAYQQSPEYKQAQARNAAEAAAWNEAQRRSKGAWSWEWGHCYDPYYVDPIGSPENHKAYCDQAKADKTFQ
jgi:hypothetical protein